MPTVTIRCYTGTLPEVRDDATVIVLDVIRATSSAVTAATVGGHCIPVGTLEEAWAVRDRCPGALLAGELAGEMPDGFDLNNSPPGIAAAVRHGEPVILLSSSGSRLMREADRRYESVLVGCLRNWRATAEAAIGDGDVVILCAGTRGEFREEDRLAAGWIGGALVEAGYRPDRETANHIERWKRMPIDAVASGNSADFLRRSNQLHDLDYIMEHVDDVPRAYAMRRGEVAPVASRAAVAVL